MEAILREIFEGYARNKNFSGVCAVRSEKEIIFSGVCGYANRAFRVLNQTDTRFDTASVTKTFTATAVLQLVEKGLLGLHDRITEIVDLKGTKIPEDVQIEHLLNHTSGIADDADEEAGEDYSALFVSSPNYAIRQCADFLKNFAYKEPYFKAGTNVRYNNCAFVLLGLALEKVTGMDYRSYVTKNIFQACDMTGTKFCAMDEINENTAEGYQSVYDEEGNFTGYKKNIYSYPPIGTPDGGAYSTAEDLDKFIRAIKNNVILSDSCSKALFEPHCRFVKPLNVSIAPNAMLRNGYAFEFLEIGGEVFCIRKDGINAGAAAMLSYYPKTGITITILANQDCDIWSMHREMQAEIYNKFYR